MSIGPIAPVGTVGPLTAPLGIDSMTGTNGTNGADFAAVLGGGLERLQSVQDRADNLAVQAATGSLTDVHDYMIAATEAALTTQLTTAVRNKALDAFNEIMRMQA